jgi:hypothetical protein
MVVKVQNGKAPKGKEKKAQTPAGKPEKIQAASNKSRGRPTDYRPEYCDKLIKFFSISPTKNRKTKITTKQGAIIEKKEVVANSLPLFEKFAHKIGVHIHTLEAWAARYPDFQASYARAKQLQKAMLITNTLSGYYQPQFAVFTAKNITDMKDVQTHDATDGVKEVLQALAGRSLGLPSHRKKNEEQS